MADVPLVLAGAFVVHVDTAAVGHLLLREIEHVPVRVVGGDAGEGARAGPLHPIGTGIFAAYAVEDGVDVLDLDPEMVEASGSPSLARIDVETDIAVADRDGAIDLALRRAPHAEQRFVEARQQGVFFADDGDVIDLGEHADSRWLEVNDDAKVPLSAAVRNPPMRPVEASFGA